MKSDFFGNREKLQKGKTATHNPEVVGSNPSPATTKKTVFDKKTVFFLTLYGKQLLKALLLGNIWGIRDRG